MNHLSTKYFFCFVLALFVLLSCTISSSFAADKKKGKKYQEIDWIELIPEDDLEALSEPPEELSAIEDGSLEDQISSQITNSLALAGDSRYQQALVSTQVKKQYNNSLVRMPGFIVPLEHNAKQAVIEFFLVPYFGACIHVPPPPPNQIIHVKFPKGIKIDGLFDPYWVAGKLTTEVNKNDLGTSAYAIVADKVELYEQ